MKRAWLTLAAMLTVSADTVVMKNGDKLTGTILNQTTKGLVFKSEFAGDVTIGWDNVTAVTADRPVVLTLKDGQKVTGTVTLRDDKLVATTEAGVPVEFERAEITSVRPVAAQTEYEIQERRAIRPEFLDRYSGFADFGFASTTGNAQQQTITNNAQLQRTSPRDKLTLRYNQIFATTSTAGPRQTTAQAIRGGWAYQRDITRKLFGNFFNDYDYDRFLLLDLRFVIGGGFGYNVVKSDRTLLTLGSGGAFNRESFAANPDRQQPAFVRSQAEMYFNQEFTRKLTEALNLYERFGLFPNLTSAGEYRFNFDAGAALRLYKTVSMQVSFSNRFLSSPPAGRQQNDTTLSTGLRYTIPTRVK